MEQPVGPILVANSPKSRAKRAAQEREQKKRLLKQSLAPVDRTKLRQIERLLVRGKLIRKTCRLCGQFPSHPCWDPFQDNWTWFCAQHRPPFGLDRTGLPKVMRRLPGVTSPIVRAQFCCAQIQARKLRQEAVACGL